MDITALRVLIIEDNPADADLVRDILAGAGLSRFDVESVSRFSDAAQRLGQEEFDVVLLDLTLPDASGLDALKRTRAAAGSALIIVLSGLEDEDVGLRAVREGAQDFLFKSDLSPSLLVRVIGHSIERHRVERALMEKEAQLRRAQKLEAVGALAGGIAHEFNNLLQVIRGYTAFAAEKLPSDDPCSRDLQEAIAAADRAAVLTRQLLTFTRHEPVQHGHVELNEVVRQLAKMVQPLIGEHIELDVSLDKDVGTIEGDAAMIQQALLNLCVNARDAMPSGGKLTVRTESILVSSKYAELHSDVLPGRYARVLISDTGCGMTQDAIERAFEPFYTTKEPGKGTGLGLAMVYGVVQQHKGNINVYSEPGVGTTAKVYFPSANVDTTPKGLICAGEAAIGTETILIAEDEKLVRDLAARILERAGYRTFTAANGEEAVRLFEQHVEDIQLVLLDVVMPGMSGRTAYEQMKQLEPDVKAVFCTGYDPATVRPHLVSIDQAPVLEKPFDEETLLRTVRSMIGTLEPHDLPIGVTPHEGNQNGAEIAGETL